MKEQDMCEESHFREKWQLLQSLRSVTESLLTNGLSNVWNVYGGLVKYFTVIERIFKHGCRIFDPTGEPDCLVFIEGLNWLQPSLAMWPTLPENEESYRNLPPRIASHKDTYWLYKSLESHTLSEKLSWLLSDKEHLLSCLEPWAFLCQDNLAEAALICLRAVEKNQPALLTEIDPNLFILNWNDSPKRTHRRSSSFPVNLHSARHNEKAVRKESSLDSSCIAEETNREMQQMSKLWASFPTLNHDRDFEFPTCSRRASGTEIEVKSKIALSDAIRVDYLDGKEPKPMERKIPTKIRLFSRKGRHRTKNKDTAEVASSASSETLTCEDTRNILGTAQGSKSRRRGITPTELGNEGKWSRTPRKSFIEGGGSSVHPVATGYFPQPRQGQSLTSFLSSMLYARTNAELDRENAHFSISEAVIAAIEQMKCNKQLRLLEEAQEDSDEEINNLQERIRLRRRRRQEEKRRNEAWSRDLLSDGRTDTTTTDQSVSPLSTSSCSSSESISIGSEGSDLDKVASSVDVGITEACRPMSKYSGSESALTDSTISAEGVALSLISRFEDKHLPRASELKWLVSEQDAPQQLLPLPKSWLANQDEGVMEKEVNTIPLRGTMEWAPPRPQIIFTPHPNPVRKILIAKQNYRCAGCGMKVAAKYAHRFRYCEYLGRYFCTACHANQLSSIPGKILSKWDFNRYPVSNFSYRLLDEMLIDPLFNVNDLNPSLYRRIKFLDRTRILRTQLSYLKDFLLSCRFATSSQDSLQKLPNHLMDTPHLYSIQDFYQVKSGNLPVELSELVQECRSHVNDCMLCQGQGFVCELCSSKDVIFPWELEKVVRCESCCACCHKRCKEVSKSECRKCSRIKARRQNEHVSI